PQLFLDRLVDRRQLLRLVDEEAAAAGLLGELLERLLRFALEVLAETDGVDRDAGAPREFKGVFELELAALVLAVGEHDERPLPLETVEVVEREDDAVVE